MTTVRFEAQVKQSQLTSHNDIFSLYSGPCEFNYQWAVAMGYIYINSLVCTYQQSFIFSRLNRAHLPTSLSIPVCSLFYLFNLLWSQVFQRETERERLLFFSISSKNFSANVVELENLSLQLWIRTTCYCYQRTREDDRRRREGPSLDQGAWIYV
jgi:hypothetical protein